MSESSGPFSQIVDGFRIPTVFSADNFLSAVSYKPRSDDLFLVTYPRCGTTWTANILMLILRKGQPLKSASEMEIIAPHIDMSGAKCAEEMKRPGLFRSHMPFHLIPWSKEAKYIYVIRNPKDCCVSYYNFLISVYGLDFLGSFDQFFEYFLTGRVDYGDYFDSLLSWYPHRNDPNVLFLTYEELKEDVDSAILKMASFIDDEQYAEPIRKDPEVMNNIKKYSSFKEMKDSYSKSFEDMHNMSEEELIKSDLPNSLKEFLMESKKKNPENAGIGKKGGSDNQFIRKGIVGDWKNYFSEEQSRRLAEKFSERTKGTDLPSQWKKYM